MSKDIKKINVPRNAQDEFYRYQMSVLDIVVQGRGNGIKTIIKNLNTVAHELRRSASEIAKYWSLELGTQVQVNKKTSFWSISGKYTLEQLYEVLDNYIDEYLLCKQCANPETVYTTNAAHVSLRCMACGSVSEINKIHKIYEYIKKHTKKNEPKETKQVITITTADEDFADTGWSYDTSAKSTSERLISTVVGKISFDTVKEFVRSHHSSEKVKAVVESFVKSRKWNERRIINVIFGCVFTSPPMSVKEGIVILSPFVKDDIDRGIVLRLINKLYLAYPETKITQILSQFYDSDILDEESIMKWYDGLTEKNTEADVTKIKSDVSKFIDWLKEAQEESEEEM